MNLKNLKLYYIVQQIPLYYIKPRMGAQFILHILLSLDHLETEIDLRNHLTLQESLRCTKLIEKENDEKLMYQYSLNLLKL